MARFDLYYIRNNINGKIYVGQTTCGIEHRWGQHKSSKHCPKLQNALKKYGTENFSIHSICRLKNIEELNAAEEFMIKELDTMRNGYNILAGGLNSDRIASNGRLCSENRFIEDTSRAIYQSKGAKRFKYFLTLLIAIQELPDKNQILTGWSDEEIAYLRKRTEKEIFEGWPMQREQAAEGLFWLAAYKKGLIAEEPCLTKPRLKKAV